MASLVFFGATRRAGLIGFSVFSPSIAGFNHRLAAPTTKPTSRLFSSSEYEAARAADRDLSRIIQTMIDALGVKANSSSEFEAAHAADRNLSRILQTKIDTLGEEVNCKEIVVPEGFPFKIIENLGDMKIMLKRNYFGEDISVEVDWHCWSNISEGTSFDLKIEIDKGEDTYLELVYYIYPKRVSFYSIYLKSHQVSRNNSDPDYLSDVEENLENISEKYLECRGINRSVLEFLDSYFANKKEREYLYWLKSTIDFLKIA